MLMVQKLASLQKCSIIKNINNHVKVSFTDNVLNIDCKVRYNILNDTKSVYFSLKFNP